MNTTIARCSMALAVVGLAAAPGTARAGDQTTDAPRSAGDVVVPATADAADAEAEAQIKRGVAFRTSGANAEALAAFQRAYTLHPTPRALAQVALARQALGDWVDAERGLEEAMHAAGDAWIAQYHEVLAQALAVVVAHLGWLNVRTEAPGAELYVDGQAAGPVPSVEPLRVVAGVLNVELRAPGRVTVQRLVAVVAGAQADVFVAMVHSSPQAADAHPEPAWRSESRRAQRKASAYAALGAAGLLAGVGIVAWRIHENEASIYDDDGRCFVGTETRDEQCGGHARTANVALGVEIGAFALAVASGAYGTWRLVQGREPSKPSYSADCGPWAVLGVRCRVPF